MGRHSDFSSIHISGLNDAIMNILEDYGDVIYEATEEGLSAAEKILKNNLKAASPGSPPHKANFAKAWKGTGKKYKLMRFVGNTTQVDGQKGEKIALANILEYSTTHGRPFIKKTYEASITEMAAAVVAEIKKEA